MATQTGPFRIADYLKTDEDLAAYRQACREEFGIPEGSMRVAPGTDAVVWLTAPKHGGSL